MSSLDGVPGCQCKRPRVNLVGVCIICGQERVHIVPKTVPFGGMTMLEPADETKDAA